MVQQMTMVMAATGTSTTRITVVTSIPTLTRKRCVAHVEVAQHLMLNLNPNQHQSHNLNQLQSHSNVMTLAMVQQIHLVMAANGSLRTRAIAGMNTQQTTSFQRRCAVHVA